MPKSIEEIGLPPLTLDQIQSLCEIGETAARKHIFSKVKRKRISDLNVTIDIRRGRTLVVDVEVQLDLSPLVDIDAEILAEEAAKIALGAVEEKLREIACESRKNTKVS